MDHGSIVPFQGLYSFYPGSLARRICKLFDFYNLAKSTRRYGPKRKPSAILRSRPHGEPAGFVGSNVCRQLPLHMPGAQ